MRQSPYIDMTEGKAKPEAADDLPELRAEYERVERAFMHEVADEEKVCAQRGNCYRAMRI